MEFVTTRVLQDVTKRLDKLDIEYMLTGSVGMICYTVFRQTADIDLVLSIKPADSRALIDEFSDDYYVPDNNLRSALNNRGLFNLIHLETAFKVDCIVKKDDEFSDSAFRRKVQTDFFGNPVWVISIEDLILNKLLWSRDSKSEMQFRDITNLLKADFDQEYLISWVNKLGLHENFRTCNKTLDL